MREKKKESGRVIALLFSLCLYCLTGCGGGGPAGSFLTGLSRRKPRVRFRPTVTRGEQHTITAASYARAIDRPSKRGFETPLHPLDNSLFEQKKKWLKLCSRCCRLVPSATCLFAQHRTRLPWRGSKSLNIEMLPCVLNRRLTMVATVCRRNLERDLYGRATLYDLLLCLYFLFFFFI